jgi:hypothetical protein
MARLTTKSAISFEGGRMSFAAPQGANPKNDNATDQGGVEGLELRTTHTPDAKRKTTKLERIARVFLKGGWHNFQSIREYGDSCLHSSISTFRHSHGIEFDDEPDSVRGFGGKPTRCKKYALRRTPENLRRLHALLGEPFEATQ